MNNFVASIKTEIGSSDKPLTKDEFETKVGLALAGLAKGLSVNFWGFLPVQGQSAVAFAMASGLNPQKLILSAVTADNFKATINAMYDVVEVCVV